MLAIDYYANCYVGNNSVFCDLWCGSGIFSIYAGRRFRKVFAVEIDVHILEFAKYNAAKNGAIGNIEFIHGDTTSFVPPEAVDVVFSEMMSTWMIDEPQALVANHAQDDILKQGGALIPGVIVNLVELGNADFEFHSIDMRVPYTQFTGIVAPRILTTSHVFNKFSLLSPIP